MVSRLEGWINDARRNSFPEEVVLIIENQAKALREAEMPEDFSQEEALSGTARIIHESEQPEVLKDIKVISRRLVNAMLTVLPKEDTKREELLTELAKVINQQVGKYIADDVKLEDLTLPLSGQPLYAINTGLVEKFKQVNPTVLSIYTRNMNWLSRSLGLAVGSTIGAIRDADPRRIERILDSEYSYFVKTAFARPQPPEKQI